MKARRIARLLLVMLIPLVITGCWDRIELEDMLFINAMGIDKGELHRYRITTRVPVVGAVRGGVQSGQAGRAAEHLTVEADTINQAIYVMNASAARRITLRHLRAVLVSDDLAREGLTELWAELERHNEVRGTAAFVITRGSAEEVLRLSRWPGEINPGKVSEGLQLVEKHLHMGPPIRLHHMVSRGAKLGISPFAPAEAVNSRIVTGRGRKEDTESAVAGELDRFVGNPIEIAGTALFADDRLVGYLTVDETQALLALRGEMGKAYVTIASPFEPGKRLTIRFQQENKPAYKAFLTPQGPRVEGRILFEGELLTSSQNYWDDRNRARVEEAARLHMEHEMQGVLKKMREWGVDPVGYGLLFRGKFATWDAWDRFDWFRKIHRLQVSLTSDMRIRRFGMTLGPARARRE